MTQNNILEYIEVQKQIKPNTHASEKQHRLVLDGVIYPNDLPETSQINWQIKQDLMFSKKKLMVWPLEAGKPGALDQQDEYLQVITRYPASKIHFFLIKCDKVGDKVHWSSPLWKC